LKRLEDLIRSTRKNLQSAGISEYLLEAELIWMKALNLDRANLYLEFNESPNVRFIEYAEGLVSRRMKREPLAYILGKIEFFGKEFNVKPGVLIPRQDTETVVEEAIKILDDYGSASTTVFDVGCGSGIIGISLAIRYPHARIFSIDSNLQACILTKQNAEKLGVGSQLQVVQSDLFTAINCDADLIIANLPYIPTSDIESLEPEVRVFEPRAALDGGIDGFSVTKRMLTQSSGLIKSGGAILLELSPELTDIAKNQIMEVFPNSIFATQRDLSGQIRVAICTLPKLASDYKY
tara:strand:+ start:3941 stop:4819 length:879 start_codon:yes stop_codon:yes gene_type:complete